jgi:hypothetical protein
VGKSSTQLPNFFANHRILKSTKSISLGFTKKEKLRHGNSARIYSAKRDKVRRNRKGKEEHSCLKHRRWEQRGSK